MNEGAPKLTLVVRELVARRATGTLTVRTPDATGEIRIRRGEIEDAVLGRAEGKKALARMLAAADLVLAFHETNAAGWLRRMEGEPEALLGEAVAARDAFLEAFAPYVERTEAFAIANESSDASRQALSANARSLLPRLRAPASVLDMLDLTPDDDASVMRALAELEASGAVRWLFPKSERQPVINAVWDRSRVVEKLAPKARIAFAGTPHRITVLVHSLLYIDDMVRVEEPTPQVPMPHVVARTAIDSLDLEIVALPLVPVYSPLWQLSLTGCVLVVRLDEAAPELLESVASIAHTRVVPAEALVGPLDEASVNAVAALLRAALDEAAI